MRSVKYLTLALSALVATALAGDIETLKKKIPLEDEKAVKIDMELALVELSVSPGKADYIVIAEVSYNPDKIHPRIDYTPGKIGLLEIESKKISRAKFKNLHRFENEWDLQFTTKVPLEINLELGLGECDLDLSEMKISDLDIDAGLAEIRIFFDQPNKTRLDRIRIDSGLGEFVAKGLLNANFDRLTFSGGLGSSELYFTGEIDHPCEAKIEVGLGSVEIYLQKGLAVKVYSEGSFLSSVDIEDMQKLRKGVYVSRNWDDEAPNRLELDLEVGLGSISVEWE